MMMDDASWPVSPPAAAQLAVPANPHICPQGRRCEEEEEEEEEGHRQATEVSLWTVVAAMQGVERKVDVHAGRLLTLERRMGLAEKKLSGTEKAMAEFGHHLATLGTLIQEYGQLQRRLENMENLLKNRNFWILRLPPGSEGETPKVPECFDEVSVYFSKQRWENLEGGQKELCEEEEEEDDNDVGKGKGESLASMDCALAKPDLIFRAEGGEGPCVEEDQRERPPEGDEPARGIVSTESPASRKDSTASISWERAPSMVGEWSSEGRKAPVGHCPGPEAVGTRSVLLEAPGDPVVLCFPEEGLACADERSVGMGHGLEPPAKRERGFGDFTTIILQEGALPGEAPYVCPECGKSFLYEEQRALHQETHPRPSPEPQGSPPPALQPVAKAYPCPECGRCFPHQLSLSKHRLWHSGERPHMRAECKKSFRRKINLRLHQQSHTARVRTAAGAKPGSYTCGQCGRGFNHHSNFLRHQMIHTGERPYACGECGKTFIRKEHLATHGRLHTGERPYRCLLCQKTFTRKQHLVGHQRLHQGLAGGLGSHLPRKRPSSGPSKTPTEGQDDELQGGGQAASF